ncbi:MAG: hypothetical protein A4E38_01354 [Methanoregulaceae archaeon PtaB.Bin108]|nr:MAG: hypothetical protein A4E38_01354 [Methanoregulaceae archaeon PtaB.Bin108]OPY46412.1 MAG: hypothetical protein A4E42_00523 [Methanoregulaceae archaeon PtaU1.Bin222]
MGRGGSAAQDTATITMLSMVRGAGESRRYEASETSEYGRHQDQEQSENRYTMVERAPYETEEAERRLNRAWRGIILFRINTCWVRSIEKKRALPLIVHSQAGYTEGG